MTQIRLGATRSKLVSVLGAVPVMLGLVGCGGGTSIGGGGTPPPPPAISVTFQSAPPAVLPIAGASSITAVVSNEPANEGVDWVLTCGTGNCGSLSHFHTASGTSTMYTAPASLTTGNSQTINLIAFSAADHTKNALAFVNVKGFNDKLNGSYIFQVLGSNSFSRYQLAGIFVADGNGHITSGEQVFGTSFFFFSDQIVNGNYTIGADGRGTITLVTADQSVGTNGTEEFSFVLLSSSQAFISEVDGNNGVGATASGTLDLQTSAAAPSGGYAFVVNGVDTTLSPLAFGGVFNVDSPGTISGTGSVADENLNGTITNSATLSGSVSTPDSFGAVTITLNAGFAFAPMKVTGYIVDPKHIKLIESDIDPNTGSGFASTGGIAIGQGNATGTFLNNSAFTGPFVYGILGQSIFGAWASSAWAGLFTADGAGNLTNGFTDVDLGGVVVSDTLTGGYSVDSSGTGRVTAATSFGTSGPGPTFVFYLTGSGSPLVLDVDASNIGAGIAYPQTSASLTLAGAYGIGFTAYNGAETDATAKVTANSSNNTLSGTADIVQGVLFTPGTPLSGTFAANPNGRFTGSLSMNQVTSSDAFYLADPTQGFIIENDGTQVFLGYFVAQAPLL